MVDDPTEPGVLARLGRLTPIRREYEEFSVLQNSAADNSYFRSPSTSSSHTIGFNPRKSPELDHRFTTNPNQLRMQPEDKGDQNDDYQSVLEGQQTERRSGSPEPGVSCEDDQYDDNQSVPEEHQTVGINDNAETAVGVEDDKNFQDPPDAAAVSNASQDDAESQVEPRFKFVEKALPCTMKSVTNAWLSACVNRMRRGMSRGRWSVSRQLRISTTV
jgi:hypothetical protein